MKTRTFLSSLALFVSVPAFAAQQGAIQDVVVTDEYALAAGKPGLQHKGPAVVSFRLAQAGEVTIDIHADANYEPKLVRTLNLGRKDAGPVSASWDGLDEKGQPIHESWRVFSATIKAGGSEAKAFWFAPVQLPPVKDQSLILSVVDGKYKLLAEGEESLPFSLQAANYGKDDAKLALDGTVIGPDGTELAKISGEMIAPPAAVIARTFFVSPTRNGICTGKFTASDADGVKLTVETPFGRVAPHRKQFERDSAFASVWVSGCKLADAIGIKNSRQNDVNWTELQKKPGEPWNWGDPRTRGATLDGFIADREKHHMWMLSILGYGEDWLGGSYTGCTIFNYDRFVNDYCTEVYRHTKDHHDLLQFWNEPNFFWHVPMDYYYIVQQRVFSRLKMLDKNVFIMGDGHAGAGSNNDFFSRMADMGYAPFTTALTVHYPEPTVDIRNPDGRVESKAANMAKLMEIRDRSFPAIEIWNTEEGFWGEQVYQRDAAVAARDLPKVYVSQIAAGVERIFWFSMQGDNMAYLLRPSGAISEPAISYAAMTQLLEGAVFFGYASPEKGIRQYLFANGGKPVIVAWSNIGDSKQSLFVNRKQVQVLDVYGNARTVDCPDGECKLTLTVAPVYITGASPLLLIDAMTAERPAELKTPAILLTDAPALMADLRKAAAAAGVADEIVGAFAKAWNGGVSELNFVFTSYSDKLPDLTDNHPSAMVAKMMEASGNLRKALEGAAGKPGKLAPAVTGLYKLDSLLEKAAEALAIWPGAADGQKVIDAARQSISAADAAIAKAEGDEYKPAARAYYSQLAKVLRKAERAMGDNLGYAAAARAKIAAAGCDSLAAVAAGEPSTIISCVVNVYVNPQQKEMDRFMDLFARLVTAGETFPVEVDIDNYAAKTRTGKLALALPDGWKAEPASVELTLKAGALATPTVFRVTAPASAAAGGKCAIGAVFDAAEFKVKQVYAPVATIVSAVELTALVADAPARPAHLVLRVVSHVDASDVRVSIEPPQEVSLATKEIVLDGVKPGSIRNPHFPLAAYAPDKELSYKVTVSAGPYKDTKEFKLKLAGDGKPPVDEWSEWERTLPGVDRADFSKGMGNWQSVKAEDVVVENGTLVIRRTSRATFLTYGKMAQIGPDFTLEFDVHLAGKGQGHNGAPVVFVTRGEKGAVRGMMVNTYGHGGQLMNETWTAFTSKVIPYRGETGELAGGQWMHMKIAVKEDELMMWVNDWPTGYVKEPPLKERFFDFRNGYDNVFTLANMVVKYGTP